MRLNKFIAQQGLASRREADRMIAAGRVRVNGQVVIEMGHKVDPDADRVTVDRDGLAGHVYVALHKPAGYTCDAKPNAQEPRVVTQLVDLPGLFPVGRLDKDSTGIILLTTDGTLVTALNHPDAHKEKEYEVVTGQPIADGSLAAMARGVPLMGARTRPARVWRLAPDRFRIVLTEGRNRQVRRMCRKVGAHVRLLTRVRVDCVPLGNLPVGAWRHLTADEVAALKAPAKPLDGDRWHDI